jgi:hypothetical protein
MHRSLKPDDVGSMPTGPTYRTRTGDLAAKTPLS